MFSRLLCCPTWRGTIRKQFFWRGWKSGHNFEEVGGEEHLLHFSTPISIFICFDLQSLDNDRIFIQDEKSAICYLSLLVATTWYKLIFFALPQLWFIQKINLRIFAAFSQAGIAWCGFWCAIFRRIIWPQQLVSGPDEKSCPLTIRLNQDGTFTCEFSTNLVTLIFFNNMFTIFFSLSYSSSTLEWFKNTNVGI